MEASIELIDRVFNKQYENKLYCAQKPVGERVASLEKLKAQILTYRNEIKTTLAAEYGKPAAEADLSEILPLVQEIKLVKQNLQRWMRVRRVKTPLTLFGSASFIQPQAKGNALIISPWNFPFQLSLSPLISAIAAGCTAIIKPSEYTPKSNSLLTKIISEIFPENEVCVLPCEVGAATHLLKKPFNHIFFTGSPKVGKIVMKAASENLASVTLELGGKSPTIIDETANIENAVKRIIVAKYFNAGQMCIAPDYLLVHKNIKPDFVEAYKKQIKICYNDNAAIAAIINHKHYSRLTEILKSATIIDGGDTDSRLLKIAPTLVAADAENDVMQEEIFGPILPLITYESADEMIQNINSKPRPLSMYIFSKNDRFIHRILNQTVAGSVAINTCATQFYNHHLPFGGINGSGIGQSHGHYGFLEFTHEKAILKKRFNSFIDRLIPPYTADKQKLIEVSMKM